MKKSTERPLRLDRKIVREQRDRFWRAEREKAAIRPGRTGSTEGASGAAEKKSAS